MRRQSLRLPRPSPPAPRPSLLLALLDRWQALSAVGTLFGLCLIVLYTIREHIPFPAASALQVVAIFGISLAFSVALGMLALFALFFALPWVMLGHAIWAQVAGFLRWLRAQRWTPAWIPAPRSVPMATATMQALWPMISLGICINLLIGLLFYLTGTDLGLSQTVQNLAMLLALGTILSLPFLFPARRLTPEIGLALAVICALVILKAEFDRPLLRLAMTWLHIRSDQHDRLVITEDARLELLGNGAVEGADFRNIGHTSPLAPPNRWELLNATALWSGLGGPTYLLLKGDGADRPDRVLTLPAGSLTIVHEDGPQPRPKAEPAPPKPSR